MGILGLIVGITVVALNDLMLVWPRSTLLPAGHNEAWLLVGLAVGAYFVKFLGAYDRATVWITKDA